MMSFFAKEAQKKSKYTQMLLAKVETLLVLGFAETQQTCTYLKHQSRFEFLEYIYMLRYPSFLVSDRHNRTWYPLDPVYHVRESSI